MFRFAICNELFGDWPHERVCEFVRGCGYEGLELAPFTLAPRIEDVTLAERLRLRRTAEQAGLHIIGLHWLLAKTTGLHLTARDAATRQRTASYLKELARGCRDLGGEVLVLGSPQQRSLPPDMTMAEGVDLAAATLAAVLPGLEETGVDLCLEPLGPEETNFINTLEQAQVLLDRLRHPRVHLHLDVKAMCTEAEPIVNLIERHGGAARHFHANDPNRRGPGMGDVDFRPLFAALRGAGYRRWISVEVFDYSPDPETIAAESIRYMKACLPG